MNYNEYSELLTGLKSDIEAWEEYSDQVQRYLKDYRDFPIRASLSNNREQILEDRRQLVEQRHELEEQRTTLAHDLHPRFVVACEVVIYAELARNLKPARSIWSYDVLWDLRRPTPETLRQANTCLQNLWSVAHRWQRIS